MPTPIRIVEGLTATNELGNAVPSLPIRYVDDAVALNELGSPVDAMPVEEVADDPTARPARVVAGTVTTNEIGKPVPVVPVLGSGGDAWLTNPEYDDYAVVMDFENNRYAMPAVDDEGQAILERDENGRFPKRAVSVAEALDITRYDPPHNPAFHEARWISNPTGAADGWSLIGGDGLGIDVPRLESWTGTRGLWVEPNGRFNRVPNAESIPALPRTASFRRDWIYTVSWVGNDDLVCTVPGHGSVTLTAQNSVNPGALNWGVMEVIADWNGNPTTVAPAGNVGRVAHSVQVDTSSNSAETRPPTTMIPTAAGTEPDGPIFSAHVDRSPEHVRLSDAVMDLIKFPGDANNRMGTGTLVVDQQQLVEPPAGGRRIVLGGGNDWASVTPSYFAFHENGGDYTAEFRTGDHNSDLSFTITAAQARSRMKLALSIQYSTATPWTNQKRAAITGGVTSSTADNNHGVYGNPAFYLNSGRADSDTDMPGYDQAGMGVFHSIMWAPEFMSEAQLAEAVA